MLEKGGGHFTIYETVKQSCICGTECCVFTSFFLTLIRMLDKSIQVVQKEIGQCVLSPRNTEVKSMDVAKSTN